jgi:peroxiredoxin
MTEPGRPGVGDPAPRFRLRRTFDEKVALEDLIAGGHPLLLAFYVFDFGSV